MTAAPTIERAVVGLLAIVGVTCTATVLVVATYTVITDPGPPRPPAEVTAHPPPAPPPSAPRTPAHRAAPPPPPSSVVERPLDDRDAYHAPAIPRPNGAR